MTKYFCDRCGKETKSLKSLALYDETSNIPFTLFMIEVCEDCIEPIKRSFEKIREAVEALPAADVKEVYHAEWKDDYCSRCGGWKGGSVFAHFNSNYCRRCGAKMDGGE